MRMEDRMRRARLRAKLSQQELATKIGVQRSAVAQWEKTGGNLPSMNHLIDIALATGVTLEWLGTGRGPIKADEETWTPAVQTLDYAQDESEYQCLQDLRRLPHQLRESLVAIIALLAKNHS
ncbi:helix-turn-helix transcriptional regulator [Lysobacter enzymogenes]|uniref:Helix-turn-helix domain-containing protein n=1 Tax=Lysobacter enzymogenes TaxID=69 RepID=A0A3N2RFR1_LYSEN|nr:helix-turn-helix domain-containing protein [Lysobacter enzymogenes]ROU06281.1 helix-turn-helix domain-containing protein [Lysobacter enzymogenes]